MSGIDGGGRKNISEKYTGSYDELRKKLEDDQHSEPDKIIRGDTGQEGGGVYLHHGDHSIGGIFGRVTKERNQGTQNVFAKLCAKLGDNETARQIFTDIGVFKKNGTINEQFRIRDFERIDERLSQLERDRLRQLSLNWQSQVTIPKSLIGVHTREVTMEVDDLDKFAIGSYDGPKKTVTENQRYEGVSDEMQNLIQSRVEKRLLQESDNGRVPVTEEEAKEIIEDVVLKSV